MKRRNLAVAAFAACLAAGLPDAFAIRALPDGYSVVTAAMAQTPRVLPVFELEKDWPRVPPQWKVGDVSSFAADADGNIWMLHRPRTLKGEDLKQAAPPVMVFDAGGNFIKAWGGDAEGYEWPQREHGIYIDYKGFVWLGGNNCPGNGLDNLKPVADDQLLKLTQDGKLVKQFGRSNAAGGNADTVNFHRPADEQVYAPTNELFVADGYGNHRIVVLDADTGAFKRMWGAFGDQPEDDDHCEIVRKTNFDAPGPQQFSVVHSLRVANDGTIYVADRENRRVQVFTTGGRFIKQLIKPDTPFARSVALSPDIAQQFLYVGNGDTIEILDRKTLEILGSINVPGMKGGGHLIATDARGNIYIANTGKGMQKLAFKGMSAAK
jgi:hypothetical protein